MNAYCLDIHTSCSLCGNPLRNLLEDMKPDCFVGVARIVLYLS